MHGRDTGCGVPGTQAPADEQMLLVVVPVSVPPVAHGMAGGGVQPGDHVVLVPQLIPAGSKVHGCETGVVLVTWHSPPDVHVLVERTPLCMPVVEQPVPT